jgi:uroporphyrinogen decarboxylase
MRDGLLRALRGERVDPRPVWLMRQAGRYLPGYRELRARHSILEIARNPSLAVKVTTEPVRRFDLDAGVIFADISLLFTGFGIDFRIDPGIGPQVDRPIRSREQVERLPSFDVAASADPVAEAIRGFRAACPDRPVIGFAGAPFTLAGYLVEGGPSREFARVKRWIFSDPEGFDRLLHRLTDATIDYLKRQREAGAHALQLFDTWVGVLSPREFDRHVRPRLEEIFSELDGGPRAPTIYFSTASAHLLESFRDLGATALGVDWRLPLGRVRRTVGDSVPLQGNLDPTALLAPRPALDRLARDVLAEIPDGRGHVFNLGHGVLPDTDPEAVRTLVDLIRERGTDGT